MQGHSNGVNSGAVTSDNKYIISGSIDKTIREWNLSVLLKFLFKNILINFIINLYKKKIKTKEINYLAIGFLILWAYFLLLSLFSLDALLPVGGDSLKQTFFFVGN